jgi:hypothetical protein
MRKSILAGVVYFGCVFAAGFALGVLRTVFVVAPVGETVAVALELPALPGGLAHAGACRTTRIRPFPGPPGLDELRRSTDPVTSDFKAHIYPGYTKRL